MEKRYSKICVSRDYYLYTFYNTKKKLFFTTIFYVINTQKNDDHVSYCIILVVLLNYTAIIFTICMYGYFFELGSKWHLNKSWPY